MCLSFVKQAREQGLKAPVILMGLLLLPYIPHQISADTPRFTGYFNPLLAHTEALAVKDAKAAGANGFIIVDLPPEEAVNFRQICTSEG